MYIPHSTRTWLLAKNEFERIGWEILIRNLRYYFRICLDALRKALGYHKILSVEAIF